MANSGREVNNGTLRANSEIRLLNFKVVLLNFPIETNEIELSIEHSPRPHNSTQALYRDILSLSCYLSAVNERKGYVPQF